MVPKGCNSSGWTDRLRRRLFQRDRVQEWKALVPELVLTLGTNRLIPLFDLSEWDASDGDKHGVKINRPFFTKSFVGWQLILNSTLNFTGNQWRECSSGTLWVNGGDFVTTRASRFWTRWSLVRSLHTVISLKDNKAALVKTESWLHWPPFSWIVSENLVVSTSVFLLTIRIAHNILSNLFSMMTCSHLMTSQGKPTVFVCDKKRR